MQIEETSDLFSREALAGYDREAMDQAVIAEVGAGAGANNQTINYALTGVGEMRCVDHDFVERSNVTRSPCFRREPSGCTKKKWKARELAERFLELSYAHSPVARHAIARVEALGLAAFSGASVIVSAVDSFAVRAYLADISRLLGIPLVESGFSGSAGHITVFQNGNADESCWRCLNPRVQTKGLSCTLYAERVEQDGRVPATQPLAALWGAAVSEAAIQAVHGNFPLGGKVFHLDIRTGESRVSQITRNPHCPGVHRRFAEIFDSGVGVTEPASKLFERVRDIASQPILRLPFPFIVDAPCARCGATVPLRTPTYAISDAPVCAGECHAGAKQAQGALATTEVTPTDEFASWSLRKLSLAPGTIVEIEDVATGALHAVRLQGGPDDIYVTRRRTVRNADAARAMDSSEAAECAATKE